jgi:hypothetical protein
MGRKRRSNERAFERDVEPSTSQPTPATLTFSTMKAVAVAEPKVRLSRYELSQVRKFKVWPLVGDTRAVAVRPKMSDRERAAAMKLLYGVRNAA